MVQGAVGAHVVDSTERRAAWRRPTVFVVSGTEHVVIEVEGPLSRTAAVGFLAVIDGVAGAHQVTVDLLRCTGVEPEGRAALRHAETMIAGRGGVLTVLASVREATTEPVAPAAWEGRARSS